MMRINLLLAASSWPFAVLLAAPVLAALFLLAFRFAHNSQQRVANMLLGLFGSFAALIALGYLVDIPENRWLLEGNTRLLVASTTVTIGAVIGVAVSVLVRRILSLLTRKTPSSPPGDSTEGNDLGPEIQQ